MRRQRLSVALAMVAVCGAAMRAVAADRPPNVLLVMTDDQGYGDVRSHGNPQIDTPAQDRIAAEGARFDRFFVSPVCAPTRASLLTGRYHLRTGVHGVTRAAETMRSEEVTLAEILKANGYATGCFGKWHNGAHYPQHPNGQGFDQFVGFCAGHWNNYFDTNLEHNGVPVRSRGYITDVFTDKAIAFIEKHRQQPWFCYVPYNAPHTPWQVPDRYWDKYKRRGVEDEQALCAYAMVQSIDENLGRLLAALEKMNLADDTIVVFLTDNGANSNRFNAGMKGRKGSLHEGGTRVPLFVRFPGRIPAGRVVKPVAAHIDLLPTLVELTGAKMVGTRPLDGRSLVPLLRGKVEAWPKRTLFTHWGDGPDGLPRIDRAAVRTDRWRAVKVRKWELYDMEADPGQGRDLAKAHPEVLGKLQLAYQRWFADVTSGGFAHVPTEIGHLQMPTVTLPGHEALLKPRIGAGISYFGRNGWANDYVSNWTSTQAYPTWPIRVVRPGRYRVALKYKCPQDAVGSKLAITVGPARVEATVARAHDPGPLPVADRIGRKEALEYEWATLEAGELDLPAGGAVLEVKALSRPGRQVVELKAVEIRRTD